MKHKTSAFTSTPMANEYWEDYKQIMLGTFRGSIQEIAALMRLILEEMFGVILWTLVITSPSH